MAEAGATQLLHAWRAGDTSARDRLMALLHDELHGLAARQLSHERDDHTLQTTALVHEAYMRLVDAEVSWQDRAHFLAITARVMRRVLVDHARGKKRAKRGGYTVVLRLDDVDEIPAAHTPAITDLDDALNRLADNDARKARVVELHYFGGLSYEEIAEAEGMSRATVQRDLRFARAWLKEELGER